VSTADYRFKLFIAGGEANSRCAERNLRALCATHLAGRHQIEVIDVVQDFEAALQARIMVTPAVLMTAPHPLTLFGTLADEATVMAALGLNGANHER
jgi:circadian clock protein KaiB